MAECKLHRSYGTVDLETMAWKQSLRLNREETFLNIQLIAEEANVLTYSLLSPATVSLNLCKYVHVTFLNICLFFYY